MKSVSEEEKNIIQKLIEYFCKNLAEDKIDGTDFDNEVLDTLENLKENEK